MKILVTGGCGYVGDIVVPHLIADKHEVTVYDSQWFGHGSPCGSETLKIIKGDVRYTAKLVTACVDHDVVLWLASISNNDMCVGQPKLAERVNFDAFATS
jgi:UDP-glucose 4-epimerase